MPTVPLITLFSVLPVPVRPTAPVRVRFSTSAFRVTLTELCSVSVPPPTASVMVSVVVSTTYTSLPAPPISVSTPVEPFSVSLPLLPVMTLFSALPMPTSPKAPVSVRFSSCAPRVRPTELCTVSVPPPASSVIVSVVVSTT